MAEQGRNDGCASGLPNGGGLHGFAQPNHMHNRNSYSEWYTSVGLLEIGSMSGHYPSPTVASQQHRTATPPQPTQPPPSTSSLAASIYAGIHPDAAAASANAGSIGDNAQSAWNSNNLSGTKHVQFPEQQLPYAAATPHQPPYAGSHSSYNGVGIGAHLTQSFGMVNNGDASASAVIPTGGHHTGCNGSGYYPATAECQMRTAHHIENHNHHPHQHHQHHSQHVPTPQPQPPSLLSTALSQPPATSFTNSTCGSDVSRASKCFVQHEFCH